VACGEIADAAEAERVRILVYKRIGELLDDPKPGNPRGTNQYTERATSHACEVAPKSQVEMNRDWHARSGATPNERINTLLLLFLNMKK
jgi:hypothetical protein